MIDRDIVDAPDVESDAPATMSVSLAQDCSDAARREYPAAFEEDDGPAPKKKRRKATPTTARTLAECRRRGWIAGVVERRIPFPKPRGTKIDLFGVIDVVAVEPGKAGAIGIQSTANSSGHHADHRAKILAEPRARAWVEAKNRLELWSWSKAGARGKQKRWTLRVEVFTAENWPVAASAEELCGLSVDGGTCVLPRGHAGWPQDGGCTRHAWERPPA